MKRYLLGLIILCSVFSSLAQAEDFRTFTGSNGKAIEAKLLGYDADAEIVRLQLKDGRIQNVKLSLFVASDQEFIKGGGSDNPFAANDSKPIGPLRITLHLSENGEGRFRLENSIGLQKAVFEGKPVRFHSLPKTLVQRNDEGILRILHDFAEADPIDNWCEDIKGDLRIDKENKALVMHPNVDGDGEGSFKINGFFRLPFNSVFEIFGKESGVLQFDVKSLGANSIAFQFKIDFSAKTVEGVLKESNSTKALFRKNNVPFDSPTEEKFRFIVSEEDARKLHGLSVCCKADSSLQEKAEPFRISTLEIAARFVPLVGVMWKQRGSDVLVGSVLPYRAGEKAGVRQGDIVKAINGKKMTNLKEVSAFIWDSRIGDELVLTIDRRGEEIEIKVRLEI